MSFSTKRIDVQFDLAQGQFNGGGNSVTVSGLRVMASIVNRGGAEQSAAEISIYGMDLSLMNRLSNVGAKYNLALANQISVFAGDDETGMSLVFVGYMYLAFVDGGSMPDVCFRVSGRTGSFLQVAPAVPVSIKGGADVAKMMAALAKVMNLSFENAGVTKQLSNPYYPGTAWQQANLIAKDAGIVWFIDKKTLVIADVTNPRAAPIATISAATGMVGYPAFNQNNIVVTALYNPGVLFFGAITVVSEFTSANGKWLVNSLEYQLESNVPNGAWFMSITGITIGQTTP